MGMASKGVPSRLWVWGSDGVKERYDIQPVRLTICANKLAKLTGFFSPCFFVLGMKGALKARTFGRSSGPGLKTTTKRCLPHQEEIRLPPGKPCRPSAFPLARFHRSLPVIPIETRRENMKIDGQLTRTDDNAYTGWIASLLSLIHI